VSPQKTEKIHKNDDCQREEGQREIWTTRLCQLPANLKRKTYPENRSFLKAANTASERDRKTFSRGKEKPFWKSSRLLEVSNRYLQYANA
jgi:hypothetical protein